MYVVPINQTVTRFASRIAADSPAQYFFIVAQPQLKLMCSCVGCPCTLPSQLFEPPVFRQLDCHTSFQRCSAQASDLCRRYRHGDSPFDEKGTRYNGYGVRSCYLMEIFDSCRSRKSDHLKLISYTLSSLIHTHLLPRYTTLV